jgi:hypothetical protein
MLGREPRQVDRDLVTTTSPERYVSFMNEVLTSMARVVHPRGYLCLMIGDVTNRESASTLNLAETVWKNAARPAGWRRLGVINDHLPQQHKVSRIWGNAKKGRATKVDRILILAPPRSGHALPRRQRTYLWDSAATWACVSTEDK